MSSVALFGLNQASWNLTKSCASHFAYCGFGAGGEERAGVGMIFTIKKATGMTRSAMKLGVTFFRAEWQPDDLSANE